MHALKHMQGVTLSWYALRLYTLVSKFNLLLEYPHCTIWFFDCGWASILPYVHIWQYLLPVLVGSYL